MALPGVPETARRAITEPLIERTSMDTLDRSGTEPRGGRALLRLPLSLLVGFFGAFATLQVIEYFDTDPAAEPLEVVLGVPDFEAYCARDEPGLRGITTTGDAFGWQCVGLVQRLWTTEMLDVNSVCQWQYGSAAFARLSDESDVNGWRCASSP